MYLKTTEDVKLDQNMHVDINSNETLFYLFDVISSKCGESCKGLGVGGWGGGIWASFHKKVPFLANNECYPKLYEKICLD